VLGTRRKRRAMAMIPTSLVLAFLTPLLFTYVNTQTREDKGRPTTIASEAVDFEENTERWHEERVRNLGTRWLCGPGTRGDSTSSTLTTPMPRSFQEPAGRRDRC
jgi:hypothetical protein